MTHRSFTGLKAGRAPRERVGEQGQKAEEGVPAHCHLPLFTHSWLLSQPGNLSGLCEDRVPLWPWGQSNLPLLLKSGADRVCGAGVPEQWGLEWDRAHMPP